MRQPTQVERLYLDFDGFFASVEQQARPALRGRPVGVTPFESANDEGILIACSREAKEAGVKSVMRVREAKTLCPDLVLAPQSPDLYRRAHNALVSEISAVTPIDAVKSIDELTCVVAPEHRAAPERLAHAIKERIARNIGPSISCSIGVAANRLLAKMACKASKWRGARYGDGLAVWRPQDMPAPLLLRKLDDIPGVGARMAARLTERGFESIAALLAAQPKQMRRLWNNVAGERLWFALHGYDVQTPPSERRMYGHSRVLPPQARLADARDAARLLLVKAARRLRRDAQDAARLHLFLDLREGFWEGARGFSSANDDHAFLTALDVLWTQARARVSARERIVRVSASLSDLTPTASRQLDIFLKDDAPTRNWSAISAALDAINNKYGRTLVSVGEWRPPSGGYAGGKIAFTRIPSAEDFW